jgi:hypothetical protein
MRPGLSLFIRDWRVLLRNRNLACGAGTRFSARDRAQPIAWSRNGKARTENYFKAQSAPDSARGKPVLLFSWL